MLCTSRASLGFAGETVWRVPPLALPDTGGQPSLDALSRERIRQIEQQALATLRRMPRLRLELSDYRSG
ncbi:MAG: hypothetical protein JOY61_25740 [Chloroflexi bacterium]|nr:hypothetical protein [Chloroflexota bacterium]